MKFLQSTLLLVFILLISSACSGVKMIHDTETLEKLPILDKLSKNMFVYKIYDDGMLSSEQFSEPSKLVVDLDYYINNKIKRGDVVYIRTHATQDEKQTKGFRDFTLARIIGLPNETIEIIDGQIFINDMKLDSFYGKQNYALAGKLKQEEKINIKKLEIASNSYYVIGDLWNKSYQTSLSRGPISSEDIAGKVIGVLKK